MASISLTEAPLGTTFSTTAQRTPTSVNPLRCSLPTPRESCLAYVHPDDLHRHAHSLRGVELAMIVPFNDLGRVAPERHTDSGLNLSRIQPTMRAKQYIEDVAFGGAISIPN